MRRAAITDPAKTNVPVELGSIFLAAWEGIKSACGVGPSGHKPMRRAAITDPAETNVPVDLGSIFLAAWEGINAVGPTNPKVEHGLKLALARCIRELAAEGVADPDQMRQQAVESMLRERDLLTRS